MGRKLRGEKRRGGRKSARVRARWRGENESAGGGGGVGGSEEPVRCHNPFMSPLPPGTRGAARGHAAGRGARRGLFFCFFFFFMVTEHFISGRGADPFAVRNHYLEFFFFFSAAAVRRSRVMEPLQRARGREKEPRFCSEQSGFSHLPLRKTRSFHLDK